MMSASASTRMPRSSFSPQMSSTRPGGSPISPVIVTIRSVPPARGRHAPPSASASASRAYASSSAVGDAEGGSTAFGIGSAAQAADEAEQQPDPDHGQQQLGRRHGQRDVMVLDGLGEALG